MSDCFLRIVPRCAPQAHPKNGISGYVVRSEGRGPGVGWGGGVFRRGWGPNVFPEEILGIWVWNLAPKAPDARACAVSPDA